MHTWHEHHKNKYLTLHSSYIWRKENCYMYTHVTVDQNLLHEYTCNSGSKQDHKKPKSCPRWQKIPLLQNFVMINNTKFTDMWQKLTLVSQLQKQESEETVKKIQQLPGQQCQVTTDLRGQCQCLQFIVVFTLLQNPVRWLPINDHNMSKWDAEIYFNLIKSWNKLRHVCIV